MFFFWTHVGAVVLLLGFLTIGLSIGSFDFADIVESEIPADVVTLAAVANILGLGVKLAAFIFHIWLPYAHGSAPTPISALLSPAMIGIGAYGLFRLIVEFLPLQYADLAIWLHIWGLVTMLYGGAMALMQDDIKRLFAYSSISQMGYLLFGIGSISALGLAGAEMMYVTHGLGKGILFMVAGVLIVQVGSRKISQLGGLASKLPITAVCAVIGALTIMGRSTNKWLYGRMDFILWRIRNCNCRRLYIKNGNLWSWISCNSSNNVLHFVDAQKSILWKIT